MRGYSRAFGIRAVRFDPFLPSRSDVDSRHRTLLCELITIPTVPFCQANVGALATIWRRAEKAIDEGCSWEACQIFLVALTNQDLPPRRILQFLFEAAFRLLAAGDQTAADRCTQKALGFLGSQSDRAVRDSLTNQWLVLATSGLLKDDFDSCELWLRQAQRSLAQMERNSPSETTRRYAGDCHAIQAQLAVQTGNLEQAIDLFTRAYDCHTDTNATCSAAQDLVLRARCYMREQNWDFAETDLAQAESLVRVVYSRRDEGDCQRLLSAILGEQSVLRSQRQAIGVARWN